MPSTSLSLLRPRTIADVTATRTELAHGSNVQKLETTATYIPESEEFEIHSPTITATKWSVGCPLRASHRR